MKMKMWSLMAVVVLQMVMVAADGELYCGVQKRPLKEVRQERMRMHNKVLTEDFHACKLKAYNNQR